jgi:hypothetical protein
MKFEPKFQSCPPHHGKNVINPLIMMFSDVFTVLSP